MDGWVGRWVGRWVGGWFSGWVGGLVGERLDWVTRDTTNILVTFELGYIGGVSRGVFPLI